MQRCAHNFAGDPGVRVPALVPHLTSKRVLAMEYIDGIKVNDVAGLRAAGFDPVLVGRAVTRVFGEMVFCHGFVHCDPHPGNMLVSWSHRGSASQGASRGGPGGGEQGRGMRDGFDIVVLDHGLYKELATATRRGYCEMWEAMILQDKQLLQRVAEDMGVGKYALLFPLIFTMRGIDSRVKLGERMGKEERERVRAALGAEVVLPIACVCVAREWRCTSCASWLLRFCHCVFVTVAGMTWQAGSVKPRWWSRPLHTPARAAAASMLTHAHECVDAARAQVGDGFSKDNFNLAQVLQFSEQLPRDMLFIIRTQNLVRALCSDLGFEPRLRFRIYASLAAKGKVIESTPPPPHLMQESTSLRRRWSDELSSDSEALAAAGGAGFSVGGEGGPAQAPHQTWRAGRVGQASAATRARQWLRAFNLEIRMLLLEMGMWLYAMFYKAGASAGALSSPSTARCKSARATGGS